MVMEWAKSDMAADHMVVVIAKFVLVRFCVHRTDGLMILLRESNGIVVEWARPDVRAWVHRPRCEFGGGAIH